MDEESNCSCHQAPELLIKAALRAGGYIGVFCLGKSCAASQTSASWPWLESVRSLLHAFSSSVLSAPASKEQCLQFGRSRCVALLLLCTPMPVSDPPSFNCCIVVAYLHTRFYSMLVGTALLQNCRYSNMLAGSSRHDLTVRKIGVCHEWRKPPHTYHTLPNCFVLLSCDLWSKDFLGPRQGQVLPANRGKRKLFWDLGATVSIEIARFHGQYHCFGRLLRPGRSDPQQFNWSLRSGMAEGAMSASASAQ